MTYDIIILGGSFAGQSAALQLGRARRRVLLIDSGRPRNRFARSSHGFLGQDGMPPAQVIATAARQLSAYETVELRRDEAVDAAIGPDGFRVALADGRTETARCLIIATGTRDILPAIPGLAERWGISVLHCPYCHGYELNRSPIGVLAAGPLAFHHAMLLPDWGPTTLFTQAAFDPAPDQRAAMQARGVTIEETPVVALLGEDDGLDAVRLADGRLIECKGLFIAPRTEPASDIAMRLGCRFEDGPTGPFIAVDERRQTSVAGVFAAGDAASPMPNAMLAAASGIMAAGGAHAALIFGAALPHR